MKFLLKTRTWLSSTLEYFSVLICTLFLIILQRYVSERRHGSTTRVPGHNIFAWHSLWQMVVCIYYTTAAVNSTQLAAGQLLSGRPVWNGQAGGTACPSRSKSHRPDHSPPACQAGRRVGPAFGLVGMYACWCRDAPSGSYLHFIH